MTQTHMQTLPQRRAFTPSPLARSSHPLSFFSPLLSLVPWLLILLLAAQSVNAAVNSNFTTVYQVALSAGIRGRMMPVKVSQADCTEANILALSTNCFGGASRRSGLIRELRQTYPNNTIVLDPGGYFYGTLFAQIDRGATVANLIDISQYDVMGIGNPDFFGGPSLYGDFLRALKSNMKIVCSNIDVSDETSIPTGVVAPYTVLNIGGRHVGVVGCVDDALLSSSSAGRRIRVNDGGNFTCPNMLSRSISDLKKANPDVTFIIALSNPQFNNKDITNTIARTVDDIDMVLTEYNPIDLKQPISIVTNIFGNKVVIAAIPYVTTPLYILGGSMNHIRIELDSDGHVLDAVSDSVLLNRSRVDDDRIWGDANAPMQVALAKINAMGDITVGTLLVPLTGAAAGASGNDSSACTNTGCNIGMFVADSMMNWCTDCDMAHINSGGLRADITFAQLNRAPNITRRDVLGVLPFGNTLVSYNIEGKDLLREVIEKSVKSRSSFQFQQFSGVRVAFNQNDAPPNTAANNVLVYVEIYNRATGTWKAYDPQAVYKVTTILYLINGGDGFNIMPYANNVNLFGVNDAENIVSTLAIVPQKVFPTQEDLEACWKTPISIVNSWTAPTYCSYALSNSIANLATSCPTRNDSSFCQPGKMAYDGKFFNSSSTGCDYCSGLGTCAVGLRTCSCDGPVDTGLFAGLQMIQGVACDQIRTEYPIHPALRIFCYSLSGVSLAFSLLVSGFFFKNRTARVIKRSSATFLQLACLGAAMGSVVSIIITLPTTNVTCVLADWMGHIGFLFLFGSLFIKTHRIFLLFSNTRMVALVLTDAQMFFRLSIIILVEIGLRLTETLVSPLTKTAIAYGGTGGCSSDVRAVVQADWEYWFQCKSSQWLLFDALKWGTKIVLTLWGVYLAICVKDIDKNYNEAKFLGLCIYNMCIFAGLCKAAVVFLDNSGPSASVGLTVVTINYVIISTLLGLALPKYFHLRDGEEEAPQSAMMKVGQSARRGVTSALGGTVGSAMHHGGMNGESQIGTTGAAPTVINASTFQAVVTRHQHSINAMDPADKKSSVNSYLTLAQQFVTTLKGMKEKIDSNTPDVPSTPSGGGTKGEFVRSGPRSSSANLSASGNTKGSVMPSPSNRGSVMLPKAVTPSHINGTTNHSNIGAAAATTTTSMTTTTTITTTTTPVPLPAVSHVRKSSIPPPIAEEASTPETPPVPFYPWSDEPREGYAASPSQTPASPPSSSIFAPSNHVDGSPSAHPGAIAVPLSPLALPSSAVKLHLEGPGSPPPLLAASSSVLASPSGGGGGGLISTPRSAASSPRGEITQLSPRSAAGAASSTISPHVSAAEFVAAARARRDISHNNAAINPNSVELQVFNSPTSPKDQ